MKPIESVIPETIVQRDSFRFIKPEQFSSLGISPSDIPLGTFPSLKHPSQLPSRFGGNAYGFGLFELYDRLKRSDIKLLQAISFENPEDVKRNYRKLNSIYKKVGLLIRFSSLGRPYYLIPVHLVSNSLTHIKAKVDEISKIVDFHGKKFLKEQHAIGVLTHADDLILHELSFRFKEHRLTVIDSIEKLRETKDTLDIVIITSDPYEIVLMEGFSSLSSERLSKRRLDQYATYILWKLFKLLKSDGEIFIIANHYISKTNRAAKIEFKSELEKKNFALFAHIFKTRRKYHIKGKSLMVNIFDFQKYLSGLYVEQEITAKLLGDRSLDDIELKEIENLPYVNFQLSDPPYLADQENAWPKLLSVFFEEIFQKPLIPPFIKKEWGNRFVCKDYEPHYMMIYLGQKRELQVTTPALERDIMTSKLAGCHPDLLADYRNSFDYVIRTLRGLEALKNLKHKRLPRTYTDRLRQPLENKKRRFSALNDVIKLMGKTARLENIRDYLNPDGIEGPKTRILEDLEALSLFGLSYNELREIFLIVVGHTPMGRIIAGKLNEKALKPLSELTRAHDPQDALNLLRYCRLMTMVETDAASGAEIRQEQLAELFELYESAVSVTMNRDLEWDALLDEKIASMGGMYNRIIRKILKMMNHFEFLDTWSELRQKGLMEKESLADYDEETFSRIENVIRLVETVKSYEDRYLKSDPLQLPIFYRKLLDMEFHGTGHLFERMDSRLVFTLLWIAVNVTKNEIVNFNPVLPDVESVAADERAKRVEKEARAINVYYLDISFLRQFSEQLYRNQSAFIVGTGFQFKVDPRTQALEVAYMDMDENAEKLEGFSNRLGRRGLSETPIEELNAIEKLFSNLESFYQSHIRLISQTDSSLKLPGRQKRVYERVKKQRDYLRASIFDVILRPENLYTDLRVMYNYTPSFLNFVLPEFVQLKDLKLSGHLYMKTPVTEYIISTARKLQALIRHETEAFQDTRFLHTLAKREFGPMAAGIVGVSETQIEALEKIVEKLSVSRSHYEGLVAAFLFQDLGRVLSLRKKYSKEVHPADLGYNGALFVEKENISERHRLAEGAGSFLAYLVQYHGLLHHIVRGELSFSAIRTILDLPEQNIEKFDAFFLMSFIVLSAIREDLILEDLADRLFQIRALCHKIIEGKTTFEEQMEAVFLERGNLFYALESYQEQGLPEGVTTVAYLDSASRNGFPKSKCIAAGKMIFATERIFRLRGIRYVGFVDIANLKLKVPLKFIYKKRKFSGIGYATFEKEVFEAFRIYNTLQSLPEPARHFILDKLVDDRIRIFGYEKISDYLSYENQIKLLLLALLGAKKLKGKKRPVCLNFLDMSGDIEKRYEAVNDYLNKLLLEKSWGDHRQVSHLFKAKTGIYFEKQTLHGVLSIGFRDHQINISQKISYMGTIKNVEQLRNYFHYSLRSLREHPFYTEDYEIELERAFERRLTEITDGMLNQTKRQMDLIDDFKELHDLVATLLARSLDMGFSEDQKNRLNDLYELRKDRLKTKMLSEIDGVLQKVDEIRELRDYWDSIKLYLQSNRPYVGKEFELMIARKFDLAARAMEER